ncbi:hypothetical protein SAMN05421736_103147 [Evansella caseinilytica]|uniref:Flagellar hook-length control protein FliK n=1 Tax=Evansella caseinilytica TaxID=1503961 RepID=A0A1H3MA10_9BACI|nr:hypothetical protein [Evansella caseinilytica]SDY72865.1 hypothetical protein SAMN05421736_103147 [Evansella caseinilytica]
MFQTQLIKQILQGSHPLEQNQLTSRLFQGKHPLEKSIQLNIGQLFQGKITKIYPGSTAQLQLGGLVLTAKLEAQLEKGQQYWFRVIGGDGIPKLKVLEELPAVPQGRSVADAGVQAQVRTVVQQLGLPANPMVERLVHHLLQENIPFSSETIRQAGGLAAQLPLPTAADDSVDTVQVLMHMIKKGLPLTKETLLSIRSLHSSESFATNVSTLHHGLRETGQFPQLEQQLTRIIENSPALTLQGDKNLPLPLPLPSLIQMLGLQHEFDISNGHGKDNPSLAENVKTLKSLLLQYLQTTASTGGDQLRESAEFILQRLTAFQLLSSDTHGPMQQLIVQLPVSFGETLRDVTLQWEGRRQKNGQFDEDHCRILFYLQLETLKETVIDVQIQKRVVSLTIYNDSARPRSIDNIWLPVLKQNLLSSDYHLTSVKWIQPAKQEADKRVTKGKQPYASPQTHYQGVDIRI